MKEMGSQVAIMDPAQSCAALVAATIPSFSTRTPPQHRFFASDDIDRFRTIGESILGTTIPFVELA